MQAWAFFRWWYGAGWLGELRREEARLKRVEDHFSFVLLLRTLFQPFRQIDAGIGRGGLSAQFRAWFDRSISRIIGGGARLALLVGGALWWCVSALVGALWLLLWPLLPFAVLVGALWSMLQGIR